MWGYVTQKNLSLIKRGSRVDQNLIFFNRCSDGRTETADANISSKRIRFATHMFDSEVGWIKYSSFNLDHWID
jgi:hypothetical protein